MTSFGNEQRSVPLWQSVELTSPDLNRPVPVVAAYGIPYVANANELQVVNLYLPSTRENASLVGTPIDFLPAVPRRPHPQFYAHVHGGAWRHPELDARSIEPTVAIAFSDLESSLRLDAVASINYTLSQYPKHVTEPYHAMRDNHTHREREAVHPQHVADVIRALTMLQVFGFTDGNYFLSGHSSGACTALQAVLAGPGHFGLDFLPDAPTPAAVLGFNGLYDLPGLVENLGPSHAHLSDEYREMISYAVGHHQSDWKAASPAHFDPRALAQRLQSGKMPSTVLLDGGPNDQLVPLNQLDKLHQNLDNVEGLKVVRGHHCTGGHSTAWTHGTPIWQNLQELIDA